MSKNLSELCVLAIDDLYGELCSRVFSTLANKGRLSIHGLLHHSGLPARHLRHGLVVLIQQNLVLHHTTVAEREVEVDGKPVIEKVDIDTIYEANVQSAYALVRYGKIIKMIEDRFGEEAAGVVSNLLLLGHAKISDFADAYGVRDSQRDGLENGAIHTNGNHSTTDEGGVAQKPHNHVQSLDHLHQILRHLLKSGYVEPVKQYHFQPDQDFTNDAEEFIRKHQPPVSKGPKEMQKFNNAVNALKRKWREDDDRETSETNESSASTSASTRIYKRPRVNGHAANGFGSNGIIGYGVGDGDGLDGEIVVRVNLEKCNVGLRNQQLVDLACRYIGEPTAMVYDALLRKMEEKIQKCYSEYTEFGDNEDEVTPMVSVTTMDVQFALAPNIDLRGGIYLEGDMANGLNGDTSDQYDYDAPTGHGGSNSNAQITAADRKLLVERHIRLLVEDPRRFARWVGNRGGGEWTVDFHTLSQTLIQYEVENSITARFGPLATRLVRILSKKGKLDEKQLATLGLLKQKDIRAIVTALHESGYVEIQEVPKDTGRQPSRTLYLWFFDRDRCRNLILADTYKAMARIHQRIKVERSKVQAVIDKAERTDVIGHEEQYLSVMERRVLRNWSEKEEKLLCQLARQDDLVGVMRDFSGVRSRDTEPEDFCD